jgi:putative adenylate-forming enzyme
VTAATRLLSVLWAYRQAKRLTFDSRAALEHHQQRRWERFTATVLARSPYFSPFVGQPLQAWPLMSKPVMMAHFDGMNTAGLQLAEVLACAQEAEHTRDFSQTVRGFSVGLSSGTSGSRGVFVVSPGEQARWAGVMLARLLPRGLFAGERVALFLRADNRLYGAVRSPWLSFEFFDLMAPPAQHAERLARYAPTIVVGPAQVLRPLACARQEGRLDIQPRQLISGAEVLEPFDRDFLARSLGPVSEVYQATEGFLGSTCAHGTMHLNESYLIVEPQWLDADRFVPVITDFTRTTQPVIRYRLDDILVRRKTPCPCGSHEMAIERVEGRCDDMLRLPGRNGSTVEVFADGLSRAIAQALPVSADYRLVQTGKAHLALHVDGTAQVLEACRAHLEGFLARQEVEISQLAWSLHPGIPPVDFMTKRRRIVRRDQEK